MAKILVVDDNDELRSLICRILRQGGHEVTEAANGVAAIRHIQDGTPELMISDIIMPDMDGLELILKTTRDYPMMKVLAITGGGTTNADLCLSLATNFGARGALLKPFTMQDLINKVSALLND